MVVRPRTNLGKVIPAAIAIVCAFFGGVFPAGNPLDGLHHDLTLAQNHVLGGPGGSLERSDQVAIVALDEKSLESFSAYPRIFMAPIWAELIASLSAAGVKAIGFDVIFAYPDDHFPVGWEQGFLSALGAHRESIVLARSERILPAPRFQAVFGFPDPRTYLGAVELSADADGVVRTIPARIPVRSAEGAHGVIPTFSNLLLAKGGIEAGDKPVRLAPRQRFADRLRAYSLSDVIDCARLGGASEIASAFSGKVVLVGTVQRGEDESRSPDRFFPDPPPEGQTYQAGECGLLPIEAPRDRTLVPSVFLHAAAIDTVASGRAIKTATPAWRYTFTAFACLLAAWAAASLALPLAILAVVTLITGVHMTSSVLLGLEVWFPAGSAMLAVLVTCSATYAWRYMAVDRQRVRVRALFNNYVSEQLANRILASDEPPRLGGELREITVMFADLVGYTAQSEHLAPDELMRVTNEHLAIVAECVEASGGYVDKFIGDAVMALWGAPVEDANHAERAVQAGLQILDRIAELEKASRASGDLSFRIRVAINSGPAIVGNVGARTRLSYSAVGATVTAAARLESFASANGISIVLGNATAEILGAGGAAFRLDKIGDLQLRGFESPLTAYTIQR